MKKLYVLLFFMVSYLFVSVPVQAQEYELKAGKEIKANYAGSQNSDYNYFKINATKSGYIEIKAKTSNKLPLTIDLCDETKKEIAKNIVIEHKQAVLHKVAKGKVYYIRTKGAENQTHSVSYKINVIDTLSYAKKYNYTFTNASMNDRKNSIVLKVKTREAGNLNFMANANNNVYIQFSNSKKKPLTDATIEKGHLLAGVGVARKSLYYINIWNPKNTIEGTTSIKDLMYQIRQISTTKYEKRGYAKELDKNKKHETLIIAGKKVTSWYEINLSKEQKINIFIESRMYSNKGKGIKLYICNEKGKVLHTGPITVTKEMSVKYKKKYKMLYPRKTITTGKLPKGTYYVKVVSDNKKSTGSYAISWK